MSELAVRPIEPHGVEAHLVDDRGHVAIGAPDLTEAMGSILDAAADVVSGARAARCSWYDREAEHRWSFDADDDRTEIRVLAFDEPWGDQRQHPDALPRRCPLRSP